MATTKDSLRGTIASECGFVPPRGDRSFRKDDLNQILRAVGGDYVPAAEVYAHDSPDKFEFYQRLAEAVGFDYDYSGDTPRPLRRDELSQILSSVE